MNIVNRKRLIQTFIDLVTIPSPSWHEAGVIEYIIRRAESLNMTWKKYPCGESHNLLLKLPGTSGVKPVLFSGHTDTVIPCENVKPVISNTRITSDGTTILGSDDKAAIAMFIEGITCILENNIEHGPIEVLLTCAEEQSLQGIKGFDLSKVDSKHAFVFDSNGRIGNIILKAPYHSKISISVRGKSAHAGMEPEKGINAINVLSEIITRLPSGRIDSETTCNIGTVSGGRATNIVADEASCMMEIRSIDKKKLKKYETIIRDIAKKTAYKHGAGTKISINLEYSGFSISKKDEIVAVAVEALSKIHIKHEFLISGGGSDTNIINRGRIKAINLSCGMEKVHTTKEYIRIKDLVDGTRLVIAIASTMVSHAGGKAK